MKTTLYTLLAFFFFSNFGCQTGSKIVGGGKSGADLPPFEAFVSDLAQKRAEVKGKARPVQFKLVEKKEKDTTSYVDWFKKNGLELKAMTYHDEAAMMCLQTFKVPAWVGKYVGYESNGKTYHLSHAIEQEGYVLLFYGNQPDMLHIVNNISLLVVRDLANEAVRYSFDFSPYGMAPEYVSRDKEYVFQSLRWAYIEAGVLYMENAHWRYSESSKGQNAYISAIDLQRSELLWRSKPLVANAVTFAVLEDVILSAYGFMREGASVFALDKQTGEVVGELRIDEPDALNKRHPEYIVLKNQRLYIKAADGTEYIVSVQR